MPSSVSTFRIAAPAALVLTLGCRSSDVSDSGEAAKATTAPVQIASSPARAEPCAREAPSPSSPRTAEPVKASSPYAALDTNWPRTEEAPRGSLEFELRWAARAGTFSDARHRWRQILARYARSDGQYKDEVQARLVQAARVELARVHYLLGETKEGDALLIQAVGKP